MGIYSAEIVAVTSSGSGIGRAGCERLACVCACKCWRVAGDANKRSEIGKDWRYVV